MESLPIPLLTAALRQRPHRRPVWQMPGLSDCVVKTMHAARISARDDAKVRIGAAGERRFQFLFHFSKRDNLFAVEMTAALWA